MNFKVGPFLQYVHLEPIRTGVFQRQSLKKFAFRVKSSDSIFFLLGLSPIVNKFDIKSFSFLRSPLRGKYCLNHLEILKRHKK